MRFKALHVRNFRALEEIDVDLDSAVNVIVGPNAIGKTTLLEAIRLAKAVVAPRSQNETNQAIFALGAATPYNPQRFIPSAIARDPKRMVQIRCRYELVPEEVETLTNAIPEMVTDFALRQAGLNSQNPGMNIAYLSSPAGRSALNSAAASLKDVLNKVQKRQRELYLDLRCDPVSARFESADPEGGLFFAFLDGRNRPSRTTFSYFPADRALPLGEQPFQLGMADAMQQIESHASQPQLKYSRLKNTIFGAVIAGETERRELDREFERIFSGILKGRKLGEVGVNNAGLLSIGVQDTETGRIFELDAMSSGEKGLILTFLLIGRSMTDRGIILIDEPELHLNPAVCKNLLTFLVDNYILRKDLQAIICSHSPEVLAGAFDRDECSLYHLVSEKNLSKIRRKDNDEISQALSRLGTSESEGLLYRATVFVEGDEDVELLEIGFGDLLRRYKVLALGGRREVEKQIVRLQEAERNGTKLSPRYFIFDRDDAPTGLKDSEGIKILQWDRSCLENYLIDLDVLTELLKDSDITRQPSANAGEVSKLLRDLALAQIDEHVARKVYLEYSFRDPGMRSAEIRGNNLEEIANAFTGRLETIRSQMCEFDSQVWKSEFIAECEKRRQQEILIWEARWAEVCDGKQLFEQLFRRRVFNMSLGKLKKRIMLGMRSVQTANWRLVESLLKQLIGA